MDRWMSYKGCTPRIRVNPKGELQEWNEEKEEWVPGRIMMNSGRRHVRLRMADGHVTMKSMGFLVARAFIGPVPEGYAVAHLGSTLDDSVENLKIMTFQELGSRSGLRRHKLDGVEYPDNPGDGWTFVEGCKYPVRANPMGEVEVLTRDGWKAKDWHSRSENTRYRYLCLSMTDGPHCIAVHKLMAQMFMGGIPEGYAVRHINGDPSDNRVENLEFVTFLENSRRNGKSSRKPVRWMGKDGEIRRFRSISEAAEGSGHAPGVISHKARETVHVPMRDGTWFEYL